MLIITRKFGESFFIGKDHEICVSIISKSRGKIKIGIDAPEDIPIVRHEIKHLYPSNKDLKIKNNNEEDL